MCLHYEPGGARARRRLAQLAGRAARPRCRSSRRRRLEDLFDARAEYTCDRERERQARVVLALLDRDDRLARHAESLAELLLRPSLRLAELAQAIVHR